MTQCNGTCRVSCRLVGVIASIVIWVLAAFLLITGVITVTVPLLWVALGVGVVYLPVLLITTALTRTAENRTCRCDALQDVLLGILGAILFAAVLLVVGITATSVVSAILVGLLAASLTLTFVGTACLVRCLADCQA